MSMHSLPSAVPCLGVSLGAGSPTLLGLAAWTKDLELVLEQSSAYSAKISFIGGLLS